ncbi:UNVERIFIED_CONTAM: hypothetical protein Sradi_6947300 [Sesamum radiatum]|uniref:Uncharacterized protein n=1 Tax=Sesamum radiatum TaxID=300843 RepID=A0AAW2JGB5_SESRA
MSEPPALGDLPGKELSKPQGARKTTMTSLAGNHTHDSRRTFWRRLSSSTKVTSPGCPSNIHKRIPGYRNSRRRSYYIIRTSRKIRASDYHNDAQVITAMIANYEVGRIFIDSGSSADILFGEAHDQMQLGDASLEKVNTSLYGFVGEVVHPRGMASLPLTMGRGTTRNLLTEVRCGGCALCITECGQDSDQIPPSKNGKTLEGENTGEAEGPAKVQPAEELLYIEIIPGTPDRTTRIGSHLGEEAKKEITLCLQRNADIFAWTPQDLEGIDPQVITHHLNIDPSYKPVKQNKRHFGPEKNKIIQAEIMLAPEDRKKVSFITSEGTFCYVAMPFGLKNADATYQRLVDKIFCPQIGRNVETGIEANPFKIKAIIGIKAPTCLNEAQRLTGRIAALSRFISKFAEKSLPFFKTLRKVKTFEWVHPVNLLLKN